MKNKLQHKINAPIFLNFTVQSILEKNLYKWNVINDNSGKNLEE